MLLQPLVENAIVHGIEPVTRRVTLQVNAVRENGHALLEVADDGPGAPESVIRSLNQHKVPQAPERKRPSLGLQNVIRRLEEVYAGRSQIMVDGAPDRGFRVKVRLPLD
jgi:sensor histidine kinase YesM